MPKQKRIKTEYKNIYYNQETRKYDIKYNYKVYNPSTQKNDYKAKWVYNITDINRAREELIFLQKERRVCKEKEITIQTCFELWKNKAIAQGYSKVTIVNGENYLKMLSEFISLETDVNNITEEIYEDIFARCRSKYTDETIKTLNATFRKLIHLAYKKRLIIENPLARVDNVRAKKTEKMRIITTEEWKKIDDYFSKGRGENNKIRFMLNVLYYTGIRIGECLALTWEDFEVSDSTLAYEKTQEQLLDKSEKNEQQKMRLNICKTILQDGTPVDTTKNKKNRKIPLCSAVIKLYYENYPTQMKKEKDRIFTNTYNAYSWCLTMACKQVGISHCSCHSFRHTFISNLMRKGVPLPVIEKVSGDTQKTIFERYSHMFSDDEKLVIGALENL